MSMKTMLLTTALTLGLIGTADATNFSRQYLYSGASCVAHTDGSGTVRRDYGQGYVDSATGYAVSCGMNYPEDMTGVTYAWPSLFVVNLYNGDTGSIPCYASATSSGHTGYTSSTTNS